MSAVVAECLPEVRFAALSGPSFALEVARGQPTALVAAASDEASARDGPAGLRDAEVPGLSQSGRGRRGAGGRAQERHRDRRRHSRGTGTGPQPARGAHHPRARRDHPARRPHGRGSAHLRRPGRHGRPGAHRHRRSEPESRPRHRAGARASRSSPIARRTGAWRRAPTARAPARSSRSGWESRCRSPSRSVKCCSSAKAPRDAVPELMTRELKSEQWTMTTSRPVQEFYSIGEVCALTDLKPHVLRYWESQFRFLNPAKNRSGNRVYKSREVELIMLVKHLLYTEKFTIDGARQRIDQYRRTGRAAGERAQGLRGGDGRRGARSDRRSAEHPRRQRASASGRRGRVASAPLSSRPMNILVTNDDGILAPGLALLADVCREVGDGDGGGAGPGAERHVALAHAASAAPAGPPPGRRVAGGWHPDRLRHARAPGADAGAARSSSSPG